MTRVELIRQVALRMDEVTPDSPDFTIADIPVDGSDNNPLYALIDGLVDAGALELFSIAPYWRLKQTTFTDIALEDVGIDRPLTEGSIAARKVIRLRIPDDFLRVAEINYTGFLRPITEVVPEMSEAGKRQHNPYLMGKEARPVGVMSHGVWGSGNSAAHCREIDCYSVASSVASTSGVTATYIPKPAVISDEEPTVTVEEAVPDLLIPALEWLIASRTFGARGDAEHAGICQQYAQNLLV